MNGQELQRCMEEDRYTRPVFIGVYASNTLPKQKLKTFPCALIANTDPDDKPGKHWCAFYIDLNGKAEFFDSYGFSPKLKPFKNFLVKNSKTDFIWNTTPLQGPFSSVCGQYCLFYLLHRCRNWSMDEICSFFTNDKNLNDFNVNAFVSENFNLDTEVSDELFMIKQISRAFQENSSL